MNRRQIITLLGGAAVAWPFAAHTQQPKPAPRVGVIMTAAADDQAGQARLAAFVQGLQQSGWTEGRNVRIDTRWTGADPADIRRQVAELNCARSGSHPRDWQRGHRPPGAGDPQRADRIRARPRSGRRRFRG